MTRWSTGLMLSLAVFVAIEMSLVRVAVHNFDGPDDPNYYQMGLDYRHSQEIARDPATQGWRLTALRSVDGHLQASALDGSGRPLPGELSFSLKRPATRRFDRELATSFDGRSYRSSERVPPGVWDITSTMHSAGHTWCSRERLSMAP